MNSEDSKKVKWFKKEFESYLSQSPIRKQIETKIELLKSKFDLHSSQWGSVHYSGQDNDCKLADYVAKKEELEKELEYAYSSKFGYLTVCPTNVGTGIRVSVMLHLPALVYTKQINKVLQATVELGLAVRGLYGEGSEALGNLFQISNQATLGMSEMEIIENISKVIRQVITYERNQRRYLINHNLKEVEDKVYRAFGILTNARIINSKETIGHLSTLRMGIDLGILDAHYRKKVNELMIISQPAHLQKSLDRVLNSVERDVERATLIRQTLKISKSSHEMKG